MMAKYIDADKLLAEIERRLSESVELKGMAKIVCPVAYNIHKAAEIAYRGLLPFINSLQQEQPMEFDANRLLEILSDRVKLFKGWSSETVSPIRIDECEQIIDIIKQLIPAQNKDWEEKRKQECSCRRLSDNGGYECERYAGAFGACDGRCSWVVDYPKLKEMEEKEQPVDLEKEIEKEWKKCNPIDEGMGVETANIHIEAFDIIARYFYELGQRKAKEE